jgi:hypothetical protein
MKKTRSIVIVAVVVLVAALVGWKVWSVAGSRAPGGTYDTAEAAVNGYLKQHTTSYAVSDVKKPIVGYHNGQGQGQYQMTVKCDCKWTDGMNTSGTVFVYLDKSQAGWKVVSVGSGP